MAEKMQPEKKGGHGIISFLIFLIAAAALAVSLFAWAGVPAPKLLHDAVQTLQGKETESTTTSNDQSAFEAVRQKFTEALELAGDEKTREKAIEKLKEAGESLKAFEENAVPKAQEMIEQAKEKTNEAIQTLRETTRESREKLGDMIESSDNPEEDKE
ncbi:hypothetical protein JXA32_08800 [Candidatus Sumerlaeota bacterium]|nr:hypothetical protein [Candidatus Sumerlaeota bacterium]